MAIPASERKKVGVLRVSAKPRPAARLSCARTNRGVEMESIVVVMEHRDTPVRRSVQPWRRGDSASEGEWREFVNQGLVRYANPF